ncbi:DUF7309 domain-containing protein [Longimicrobium sp.]|uniref:DUF7309 domain-containing protein n=1 Tax=Longimicrobium sp. TaxID=2029185 RepID=UPI003BB97512
MERDRAAGRTLRLVGGGRVPGEERWNLAARAAEAWDADVVPLQGTFREDPDAAPAILLVGAAGFVLAADVLAQRPVDVAGRARAVSEAVLTAGRTVGVLPPALHVRDEALVEALAPGLEPRGIAVAAAPMPELDEAIFKALRHIEEDGPAAYMSRPDTWRETEATPEEIAAFHAAAAAFHRAAPWLHVDDTVALELTFDDGQTFIAAVMGGAGIDFGLSLYSDPADIEDLYESFDGEDPMETVRRMRGFTVTVSFDRRSHLSRAMQREVARAGWEIDGPGGYPEIYGMRLPGFRVTAGHVRMMTGALAAVTREVCGDAAVEGIREILEMADVSIATVDELDDDDPGLPWPALEVAHPIGPVGPNADPGAALRNIWASGLDAYEELRAHELARVGRFEAWLAARGLSKAAQRRHLRNARVWSEYLAGMEVSAGAATEFDLRTYLYDWFPRKETLPKDVERALDDSLRTFFGWLEAEEGIGYPWAAGVLAERADVALERGAAPEGGFWDDEVMDWRGMLWADFDRRAFLHDSELPGTRDGWPTLMNNEVARLRNEVQRRWLVWYDEAVRGGVTEPEELRDTLALRQRGWENTPHPQLGGHTPRQVVTEYERQPVEPGFADLFGKER